jgi:hypothetical protein
VLAAFVLGGVVGVVADRATSDPGPMRGTETVAQAPIETLEEAPEPPLRVFAETVRLPDGFESRRVHGGPAFTFVLLGRVEIERGERRAIYGPGAFFFVPEGELYTLRVLDTAQVATLRLVPPGAQPTTEVR